MRARAGAGVVALLCAAALWPQSALAHGLAVRQDVPIPTWLFAWGATIVLVASFVALATLWPRPRLQEDSWRPLPAGLSRILLSRPVEIACGAIGVFLLGLVVWSGLKGTQNSNTNFAPSFVYIIFWLGFVPLSLLFGDVFRAFNPWRAAARAVGWVAKTAARQPLPAPLQYPQRLGYWPAVAGVVAFGWLEIAAPGGDEPDQLAIATLIYSVLTWVAMTLYGVDGWTNRGEAFSVYFNLISRLSVVERREGRLGRRRALSGLAHWEPAPGAVLFVVALIGTVSFDGFSAGPIWTGWASDIAGAFESVGLSPARSLEATFGSGLIAAILLTFGLYYLAAWGAHSAGGGFSTRELAATFAHSLAPIALVYAAAHYVSFLLLQGQAIIPLASDPLGRGSDLFGTAAVSVDYGLIGSSTFWYLQVGFVVAGHVAGLVLAHDRAIAIYDRPRIATQSQYWMLAVMVAFTSLALWLLSEASG